MAIDEIIIRYIEGWRATISLLRRPSLFVPFVVIAGVKSILLVLAYLFWHPFFSRFMVPVIENIYGEQALHFPRHIVLLPDMYRLIEICVILVLGAAMFSWGVSAMAGSLEGKRDALRHHMGAVFAGTPKLIWVAIAWVVATLIVPDLLSTLVGEMRKGRLQQLASMGVTALGVVARALVVYCFFFVTRERQGLFSPVIRGIRFAWSRIELSVAVVMTSLLFVEPFIYLSSRSSVFAHTSPGETAFTYLMVAVVMEIPASFYLFGTIAYVALGKNASS